MGARLNGIQEVTGSIPVRSTNTSKSLRSLRVFLDDPFPTNLPVVAACLDCNSGFSRDEEYVACLIESAIAGNTDPERIKRAKVAQILRRSERLRRLADSQMRVERGRLILDADKARLSKSSSNSLGVTLHSN